MPHVNLWALQPVDALLENSPASGAFRLTVECCPAWNLAML